MDVTKPKGKERVRKLTLRKETIKDLEPKGKKDIKAGGNVGQVQASACAGCTGAACL